MNIYIQNQFAFNGDTTTIPQTDPDGFLNWDQGYGIRYSLDKETDPNALDIDRGTFNDVLYVLSGATQNWQQNGNPPWITPLENRGIPYAYALGATVLHNQVLWQTTVAANVTEPEALEGNGWIPARFGPASPVDFGNVRLATVDEIDNLAPEDGDRVITITTLPAVTEGLVYQSLDVATIADLNTVTLVGFHQYNNIPGTITNLPEDATENAFSLVVRAGGAPLGTPKNNIFLQILTAADSPPYRTWQRTVTQITIGSATSYTASDWIEGGATVPEATVTQFGTVRFPTASEAVDEDVSDRVSSPADTYEMVQSLQAQSVDALDDTNDTNLMSPKTTFEVARRVNGQRRAQLTVNINTHSSPYLALPGLYIVFDASEGDITIVMPPEGGLVHFFDKDLSLSSGNTVTFDCTLGGAGTFEPALSGTNLEVNTPGAWGTLQTSGTLTRLRECGGT